MIIDCVADLHGHFPTLEGGDLLIIAGDLTACDTIEQQCEFTNWLYEQKYKKKIVIAGNHDNILLDCKSDDLRFSTYNSETGEQKSFATYLCDSIYTFEGIKIWGTPWTPWFYGVNPACKAFMANETKLKEKFDLILQAHRYTCKSNEARQKAV